MNKGIYVLITNLGVVKVKNQSKIDLMTEADSILLAGAFMSVARVLYFNNLNPDQATDIMNANTVDFVELMKPTIH